MFTNTSNTFVATGVFDLYNNIQLSYNPRLGVALSNDKLFNGWRHTKMQNGKINSTYPNHYDNIDIFDIKMTIGVKIVKINK